MNDDQEHPRDPALSRLLRQTPQAEPPSRLDAIILAAARHELAPRRRPRSWWQRFQAPLALAATVTLAIGLSLTLDRIPPGGSPNSEIPLPASAPQAKEKAATAQQPAAADATAPSDPHPAAEAKKTIPTPPPERQAASPEARMEAARPSAPPAPPAPAPRAVSPAVAGALEATASTNTIGAAGTTASSDTAPAAAELRRSQAAPAAKSVADAKREERSDAATLRSPESWLDDIRRLRRLGNHDEAARQLAEFRRTYPGHPLPEDFR